MPRPVAAMAAGLAVAAGVAMADDLAEGRRLFVEGTEPACAICHSLADAGAEGEIGPSLDELRPDAARVARAVRGGVGVMPAFQETLSEDQIAAIAAYVARAAGGG
ncbi:c-type cytochrome [Rubrimonas cliftonensis]|uniref:Sulfite dehydrogenase (Cytochrome) subunit SorB n=1 Tax=Rubrimonas cliftonensis TaxID=89524 RepID=A0A1H4DU88_9RHOB|nr:cytochrome c [Rubrimonas cliftonensis]SEA76166.1 sulfite dehydrogenase (cytochrome) subunit SorB [Rubrimonas cliftonensis]